MTTPSNININQTSYDRRGFPPEPPTTCCNSGCANCVWFAFADELSDYYKNDGVGAKKAIDQIKDSTLRTFLMMELKHLIEG